MKDYQIKEVFSFVFLFGIYWTLSGKQALDCLCPEGITYLSTQVLQGYFTWVI